MDFEVWNFIDEVDDFKAARTAREENTDELKTEEVEQAFWAAHRKVVRAFKDAVKSII